MRYHSPLSVKMGTRIGICSYSARSRLLSDYKTAMESMKTKLLRYSEPSKLGFVGELLAGDTYSPKMVICLVVVELSRICF